MREIYVRSVGKILRRIFRKIRIFFNIDQVYRFGGVSIVLPPDHLLPLFQLEHPMHERLIPLVAGYLEPGELVIDVGANCGDSMALMHEQNPDLRYVCIEPDHVFLRYLHRNIKRINESGSKVDAVPFQCLVGSEVNWATLSGRGGTKSMILAPEGDNSLESRTLDSVCDELDVSKVRFIKSDVDGFDYDVLNSAVGIIEQNRPVLFFEAQINNQAQLNGFEDCFNMQVDLGYAQWLVFDNFGNLVLKTNSVIDLMQLLNYVWRQSFGVSTRTIYYVDILAVVERDYSVVEHVLAKYAEKFPAH